jgi:hypothetical protein
MNTLTSIDRHTLRFDFPAVREQLRQQTAAHLEMRIKEDSEHLWSREMAYKTQADCEGTIERITREVVDHLTASATITFQRTLRIPDDGKDHWLPPGLGAFPLKHVDDFAGRVPEQWSRHGGAMLPMHQSEALWINFDSNYPIAMKVGAGKICAVSGEEWREGLRNASLQNYCVLPNQPWIDGFAVEKGIIRQFIAEPLGSGFTVEEQLTGEARWGGIQFQAFPLDPALYWQESLRHAIESLWRIERRLRGRRFQSSEADGFFGDCQGGAVAEDSAMGLGAGGRMKQDIYKDDRSPSDYLDCTGNRCFLHLCNSEQWELITGEAPPDSPPTARDYSKFGLPWFDYYDEKQRSLEGGAKLKGIMSVTELERETGKKMLPPQPDGAQPKIIVKYIKE